MKNFKNNIYSKTYTHQTMVVDNVKYRLAENRKTMVKLNSNGKPSNRTADQLARPTSALNASLIAKSIINKHRILRENNYRFASSNSIKRAHKSKFKLILKKPNRFKFNKLNRTRTNGINKTANGLYKKIYNTVPKIEQRSQIQQIRKKAVKSSINYLIKKNSSKLKKNNKLKLTTINTTYCMFFCRFGRCAKIDTCKYKHDKDKVAVCKNFLKGKCEVNGCLLSHKMDPKKMPVCSFYLKGICNIDHCPYRHVNVNVNAEICKDFVRGFCEKGDQCKLLHQYAQTNKCSKCKGKQECECKKLNGKRNRLISPNSSDSSKVSDNSNESTQKTKPNYELIEIRSESNSNMDISDDDICRDSPVDVRNLDFIPLVRHSGEELVVEQDGRRSRTQMINESNDNSNEIDVRSKFDYDSDDTWFEDDGKQQEFFQFIPEFLLN